MNPFVENLLKSWNLSQFVEKFDKNLAPSELKKLRNKQRKQRRKAELEKQQLAQAQEKREQHNKSRQQADPDLEQPTLDELIPEKLERVEDPLEQAIKFLLPLQELAANKIETHLMAFEIYIRKGRTLLMLRSIKRAHQLEPNNPDLHCCLVRFLRHTASSSLDKVVSEVVKRQSSSIFAGKSAEQLNSSYLELNAGSLAHLHQGARMLYLLDPSAQQRALGLATRLDVSGVTLQTCVRVLEALRNGDFGPCDDAIADYAAKCHQRFPYATAFRPPSAATSDSIAAATTATVSSTSCAAPVDLAAGKPMLNHQQQDQLDDVSNDSSSKN